MPPCAAHPPPKWTAFLLGIVALSEAPPALAQDYHTKGRWHLVDPSATGTWDKLSGSTLLSGGGTHMALLRGNADSSWVLHWHNDYQARLWLTKPMDNVGVGVAVPYDNSKIFCSGHTQLADGKLLVVGGTLGNVTGENRCHTFEATRYFETSKGWVPVDTTEHARYYPTATTLHDGKVLATAGYLWKNLILIGGVIDQSGQPTALDETRLLNVRRYRNWQADPTSTHPPQRQGTPW